MFWSLLQSVGGQGVSFFVTIILARLLTPEIFGLIGMLMIFIQVSQILVVAGFNQALIQKKDTDEEDYSSVFWINLSVSLLIYVLLFFTAPWIAVFYEQPILIELTRVLSLVFVINAFSYVQEARLNKEMRFKTLTIIGLPSTVIGGVVAIIMALMGYGVWSLIALQLVTRLAYGVQIWLYAKWKPLLIFNKDRVKSLFSFGGKLMVSAIINTVFQNAYVVIIAKFYPLSAVGYYQNSFKVVRTPSSVISSAIAKVTFPVFSSIQQDNNRLKEGLKKINQQILFWVCPTFVIAGVLADPIFSLVFGEKWLPSVPYFQWLCIVGIFYPLSVYNLNVISAKGLSAIYLKLTIVKKVVFAMALICALPFGIWALLAVQAFNIIFSFLLNSYYLGKFIDYPLLVQIKDISSILVISLISGIAVYLIGFINLKGPFIQLFVEGGSGIIIYYLLSKLFRVSALFDFEKIFRENRGFKFTN